MTAILKQVAAALSMVRTDPKPQALVPFLEAAREAERFKALHAPKPV